jgi:hypothetical protein
LFLSIRWVSYKQQIVGSSFVNQFGRKKFMEFNANENTTYQNLWDTAKAVQRGKFIVMSAYIKNKERSQINDLMLHLKLLEKQAKPKIAEGEK